MLQVLGILCMSLASPAFTSGTHWFLFVVVSAFIATLIWIFVYLLGIREALRLPINWILTVRLGDFPRRKFKISVVLLRNYNE